ncbi:MAG: hypothetical protein QM645_09915 [Asticcacaulis sp.]
MKRIKFRRFIKSLLACIIASVVVSIGYVLLVYALSLDDPAYLRGDLFTYLSAFYVFCFIFLIPLCVVGIPLESVLIKSGKTGFKTYIKYGSGIGAFIGMLVVCYMPTAIPLGLIMGAIFGICLTSVIWLIRRPDKDIPLGMCHPEADQSIQKQ